MSDTESVMIINIIHVQTKRITIDPFQIEVNTWAWVEDSSLYCVNSYLLNGIERIREFKQYNLGVNYESK